MGIFPFVPGWPCAAKWQWNSTLSSRVIKGRPFNLNLLSFSCAVHDCDYVSVVLSGGHETRRRNFWWPGGRGERCGGDNNHENFTSSSRRGKLLTSFSWLSSRQLLLLLFGSRNSLLLSPLVNCWLIFILFGSFSQMVLPFRRRQLRQRPSAGQHAAELPLARRLVPGQAEYQSSSGNLGPWAHAGKNITRCPLKSEKLLLSRRTNLQECTHKQLIRALLGKRLLRRQGVTI